MFAGQHGMAPCDIDSTFRVDPITNVPFLHDDPQVPMLLIVAPVLQAFNEQGISKA